MAKAHLYLFSVLILSGLLRFSFLNFITTEPSLASELPRDSVASIMFYNVENFFDVKNDSLKNDEEFLPDGLRRWTYWRMKQKMLRINRVILNAGGWNPPVIVGLCEVENSWVLTTMIWETGLSNLGYRVVHFESPDERGIDVALLYRHSRFEVVASKPLQVNLGANERPTRDILYVKGVVDKTDTLHILVNHWPSRLGGAIASHWKRKTAASVVKRITDSIYYSNPKALMVIMGDFNESPESELFLDVIDAGKLEDNGVLVNPALYLKKGSGTLKYKQDWDVFDQIIVSRAFFEDVSKIKIESPQLRIIDLPFLFEQDLTYGGMRPYRTYSGFKYAGGFSDHLPVWIDLEIGE